MRITFLCTSSLDYPSPRGRWFPLARELAARGHTVTLLLLHHTYDRLPISQRHQMIDGVLVRSVGQMHVYGPVGQRRYFGAADLLKFSLLAVSSLASAAVQTGCDMLHICKPQPLNGMAGLIAARVLRCPFVVDCDDYEAGGNRFGAGWQQTIVQLWEDHLPRMAAGVTVNTRFLQQRCQTHGVPANRMVYVPNGIAPERLTAPPPRTVAGLRAALGLAGGAVVAYVGTLSQTTHNVGLLLEAFALVVKQVPLARLLLVGDGEDRTALQEQARQHGIGAHTLFVGAVPYTAVPVYLSLATCSVDPVNDDAVACARSPLKIVESMAVGVPVVTGGVGDRAEMLAEGTAGVLVAPGNAAALAEGIVRLLRDDTERAAMSNAAHQRASAYAWPALVRQWESVYN